MTVVVSWHNENKTELNFKKGKGHFKGIWSPINMDLSSAAKGGCPPSCCSIFLYLFVFLIILNIMKTCYWCYSNSFDDDAFQLQTEPHSSHRGKRILWQCFNTSSTLNAISFTETTICSDVLFLFLFNACIWANPKAITGDHFPKWELQGAHRNLAPLQVTPENMTYEVLGNININNSLLHHHVFIFTGIVIGIVKLSVTSHCGAVCTAVCTFFYLIS